MSIPSTPTPCPGHLSDGELLAEVARAAAEERHATAHLLVLLIELDARRLYLGEGFSSLFTYCTQALHLSEHAAYNRIEAARAARRFPIILEYVGDGALTLTAVRLLAPHVTPDNHRDVLASARHKGKREVELLVASLHPQPDVPTVVHRLPTPAAVATSANLALDMQRLAEIAERVEPHTVAAPGAIATPPAVVRSHQLNKAALKPIAPERYKIQFTAGRETYEKLQRAQDLLRHVVARWGSRSHRRSCPYPAGEGARADEGSCQRASPSKSRSHTRSAARARGCEEGHLAAGWRPVRVRWDARAVRGDRLSRVSPRGAVRGGRSHDRGESRTSLSRAQSA